MSMPTPIKVTCPTCNKEADFTMWRTLNSDVSPGMLEKFFSGEIFEFTCPNCGKKTRVCYPILYHDMTNQLMISYAQEESYQKDMLKESAFFLKMGYKYRIVYDDKQLIEKALIFHEGFDDRTIEILKFVNTATLLKDCPDENIEHILFVKENDVYKFIFFGKEIRVAVVSSELIEEAHEHFSQFYMNEASQEYEIDQAWAENVVRMLSDE